MTYEKLSLLGAGSFGSIHRVRVTGTASFLDLESETGEYAMKKVRLGIRPGDLVPEAVYLRPSLDGMAMGTNGGIENVLRVNLIKEITVLRNIQARGGHPNILCLYGVHFKPHSTQLFLPLMHTDLQQVLLALQRPESPSPHLSGNSASSYLVGNLVSMDEAITMLRMLLSGLCFLHNEMGLLHRDLKPGNLLFSTGGILKIADFGLATPNYEPDRPGVLCLKEVQVGTRWYKAPEIVVRDKQYSYPADLWSVGCVLYELSTGRPLFESKSDFEHQLKIFGLYGKLNPAHWPEIACFPDYFCGSFSDDASVSTSEAGPEGYNDTPADRERILKHIFPGSFCESNRLIGDLVLMFLVLNPAHRCSAAAMLAHLDAANQSGLPTLSCLLGRTDATNDAAQAKTEPQPPAKRPKISSLSRRLAF